MKKYTKKAVAALAPVLAVSMLAPTVAVSNVASAAEGDSTDVTAQVLYSVESLAVKTDAGKKIYVQEVKADGKAKGEAELYKKTELSTVDDSDLGSGTSVIDISEYTKKGANLQVYSDKDTANKVSVTLNKQATKVKAVNKEGKIEFTVDSVTVSDDAIQWRTTNASWKNDNVDLTKYYKRGATLYVRQAATDSSAGKAKIDDGAPASKEAKLKIAKQAKAPKVTMDPVKNTFKFPNNCEVKCTEIKGEPQDYDFVAIGTEKADKNPTLETFLTGKKLVSSVAIGTTGGAVTSSYAAIFEVRTAATAKKPASKIAEVKVPWQPVVTVGDTVSATGISYDVALNAKKTQATGLVITNKSEAAYQYAVVKSTDDLSNVKWKKVASKKTAKVSKKAAEAGSIVIYRSMGVKDNKKTADVNEFAWASEIAKDTKAVAYPVEIKTDLAVTAAPAATAGTTASKTAISVTKEDGFDYYYAKADKAFKKGALLEIGTKIPSGATMMTNGKADDLDAKKGDVYAVYKTATGSEVVVQAGSVKIEAANLK